MKTAVFASGCFWGTQYFFSKATGVIRTQVGYSGGKTKNPTYEEVSKGDTGHVEAVEIIYDENKTNFEKLSKLFFETHDPTQVGGQGPDIGSQYQSVVFVSNKTEEKIAKRLVRELEEKGLKIATKIEYLKNFYKAEDYHQNYYQKNFQSPYCHRYKKLF